jgi:hypothetical protein
MKNKIKRLIPDSILEYVFEVKRKIQRKLDDKKLVEIIDKNKLKLITIGNMKYHTFFGYYDLSPFNIQSDEIIYLRVQRNEPNCAEIILHDLKTDNQNVITITRAWNWQQGSRLRWYPNSKDKILFNDVVDGIYKTKIINVRNNECSEIDLPVYDVDNNGMFAITLDFERLGKMRPGYGYSNLNEDSKKDLKDEGVTLIDLNNHNEKKLIVTYKKIANVLNIKNPEFQNNYINHLSFSPDGKKFLFFWIEKKKNIHHASLLVYDIYRDELTTLEIIEKVSHYVWLNSEEILCTVYCANNKCNYFKYSLSKEKEIINPNMLINDGHPSIINDNLILTDTYPDKNGFQKLFITDIKNEKIANLLEIYSYYKPNPELRTDLHPRLSLNKKNICFDANINGYRQLFILNNVSNSYSNYCI